ncbi:lipoprotein [Shewanella colwelliana]|uniref:hypothetical protein n=1 Tax=Shewanella colwelliana TaxID=23 RepID=UPI001BBFBF52|nr:hypothetical protein [Shewanella colwelliana]GIU16869.1 lipoprotein [Shewanella colwelliana]
MKKIPQIVVGTALLSLSACGFIGDDKAKIEQEWLEQDQQLKSVIEQIRTQGIDVVARSAQAGSISACVANGLSDDPLGQLVSVEGALVESAQITDLMSQLQGTLEQDVSIEQVINLLQQGADLAAYGKALVDQQGLEQALQTLDQLAQSGGQWASEDLDAHFQQLLLTCREQG